MSNRRIGLIERQLEVKRGKIQVLFGDVFESESEFSGSVSSINEDDNHEMDIE